MPVVEFAALTAPVSDSDPCGPDLDLNGDPEFMNFMARAEGLLPATFFAGPEGTPFDATSVDWAAEFKSAAPLLEQTRDLRLIVLLAKFGVLNRDIDTFIACIRAVAALLEAQWDHVHPRGEGDDGGMRSAVIETLNDGAPVVMPLQYLPLVQSRRGGSVCYRAVMFAAGEAQPREGEETYDRSTIDRMMMEAELADVVKVRDQFEALQQALGAIGKLCAARGQSVNFEKLSALVGKIFAFLNETVAKRDPSAAAPVAAEGETNKTLAIAPGQIRSKAHVAAALAAIDGYFCGQEPSNPALLLVRQARQLMNKSFLEVLQILVPGQVGEAKFRIGGDHPFDIPVESLSALATVNGASFDGAGGDDVIGLQSELSGTDGEPSGATGNACFSIASRAEAFALLEQVAAYYRVAEPSSPISSILDRARGFANRDFVALLRDLLAAQA